MTFTDGQHVPHVDTVMYCTGYLYTYPFLDNIVSTADNRSVAFELPWLHEQCLYSYAHVQGTQRSNAVVKSFMLCDGVQCNVASQIL